MISVVIPAYNEETTIPLTIQALEQQTLGPEFFEVVVVDDGSTDNTAQWLRDYSGPLQLKVYTQKNQGQGNARNNALAHTQGEIILFLGADAIAAPTLLEEHKKAHEWCREEIIGVLGHATWDPAVGISPLMYFMEHGGHQFAYDKAKKFPTHQETPYHQVPYTYFYTINISLKASLLAKDAFDPTFTSYGWEDIELGHRLQEKYGFQLLYNPYAKLLHHEKISEERWENKMFHVGKNGVYVQTRYPNLQLLPTGGKKVIFQMITIAPLRAVAKVIYRCLPCRSTAFLYYYIKMKYLILKGMQSNEGRGQETKNQ